MHILFIGHSLIEFFDWQQRFPGHRVVNLGVAGEMVEGLLRRVGGITRAYSTADLIFIMSGLNDVVMEEFNFLNSYGEIISRLKATYPTARIFIHSLLPTAVDFIDDADIWEVNGALQVLARSEGVEYIDLYGNFTHADGSVIQEYLLADGVHLSERGYEVWSKVIEEIINRFSH